MVTLFNIQGVSKGSSQQQKHVEIYSDSLKN